MHAFLRRGRFPFLVLVLLSTAFFAYRASQLKIDHSNHSMNAANEKQQAADDEFAAHFGSSEFLFLALGMYDGLTERSVTDLGKLTADIEMLPGVRRVNSLSNARYLISTPSGAEARRIVQQAPSIPAINEILDQYPEFTGTLVSRDRFSAMLVIRVGLDPENVEGRKHLLADIRRLPTRFDHVALTGLLVQKMEVARLVARDQRVVFPVCAGVMALLLLAVFRRLGAVILPMLVTGVSLAWTLGIYELLGFRLNPITSLLPPVVMVLAIATSVHLIQGWNMRHDAHGIDRIVAVVHELRKPCFFTALTTMFGLFSLLVSETPAIGQFGGFAALGVFFAFVFGITLTPVGLSFLREPGPGKATVPGAFSRFLEVCVQLSTRRPQVVMIVAGLLTIMLSFGIMRLQNNTDLIRFLKNGNRLVRDTEFVERQFGGSNVLELMVARTDGQALHAIGDWQRIERLAQRAEAMDHVSSTLSLATVLTRLNQAEFELPERQLPEGQDELMLCLDLLHEGDAATLNAFLEKHQKLARITIRIRNIGTARGQVVVDAILDQAEAILGPEYAVTPVGDFYRVVRESNQIVIDQVSSFALALVLAMCAIGLLFRSARALFLAFIPNVVPIFWTLGLMGYAGIELSAGTAMIASVAIGLAVDDTIYYMARFRREYRGDIVAAVSATTRHTGKALVVSSLVLVCGFWTGALGSFRPSIYFSFLTGATMISALLCDLIVLPAVLITGWRQTAETS